MGIPTRTLFLVVTLLVHSSPGVAPGGPRADSPSAETTRGPALEVTYVANEGFLLEGGGRKVLIDALFGDGVPGYATIPDTLRPALEQALPPFDGVDLVLATHVHDDHFDAESVARHLRANPAARFVSTPQTVKQVRALVDGEEAVAARLRAVAPEAGERVALGDEFLGLEVLHLSHGKRIPPIRNLGFVLELGDWRVLHVGDLNGSYAEVRPHGLAGEGLDAVFVPLWLTSDPGWVRALREELRPAATIVMHISPPGAPAPYFGESETHAARMEELHAAFPEGTVFEAPGEKKRFELPRAHGAKR